MIDPILMGLGLFIGTLVGLTGVGGGSLLTPLLILFVGVKPMTAIGTDLAFAAITKGVGAFQHMRHGKPDLRLVYRLLLGSIPGAILGAWLMSSLEGINTINIDAVFTRLLGVVLIISAAASLLRIFNISWIKENHLEIGTLGTAVIGGVVGIMVGCTSIGAGSLLMAMISIFFRRLPITQAVGVDVAHGAMLAMVAAMAHGAAGRIEVPIVMNLLVGSLPGGVGGQLVVQSLAGSSAAGWHCRDVGHLGYALAVEDATAPHHFLLESKDDPQDFRTVPRLSSGHIKRGDSGTAAAPNLPRKGHEQVSLNGIEERIAYNEQRNLRNSAKLTLRGK